MNYDPEKCQREIYEGPALGILACSKNEAEEICALIREKSDQRVDWHFSAGRPVIRVHSDDDIERAFESFHEVVTNRGQQYLTP